VFSPRPPRSKATFTRFSDPQIATSPLSATPLEYLAGTGRSATRHGEPRYILLRHQGLLGRIEERRDVLGKHQFDLRVVGRGHAVHRLAHERGGGILRPQEAD